METKEIKKKEEQDAQSVELKDEELAAIAGGETVEKNWQTVGSYGFVDNPSFLAK